MKPSREVLIIYGGWDGHQPAECTELFADRLARRGFTVKVSDTLDALLDPAGLGRFSLIVPIWTMGQLSQDQCAALVTAVRDAGTGLAGFHGGMGDAFRGNLDFQWMVGGQFVAHPDEIKTYTVNILRRDDPIVAGLGDFQVTTEHYYMLVDPANEVLATAVHRSTSTPWVDGVTTPVVWKKMHGAGRIFYSALGHQCADFTAVPEQLDLTLRGMVWAARP